MFWQSCCCDLCNTDNWSLPLQWANSSLQWRHNGRDGVSNHRRLDCVLNCLFRRRSKKTSKLRVTGLCEGNPPRTGGFPSQSASNTENVSIWWRYHVSSKILRHMFHLWMVSFSLRFNINTIFLGIRIHSIKIRLSWDLLIFMMRSYIGNTASLYWNGLCMQYRVILGRIMFAMASFRFLPINNHLSAL